MNTRNTTPRIHSIEQAVAILAAYVPAVKEITGKDITLERMTPLMDVLGNPQNKLRIIHVAGTSGKTSTAYYIATMLQQQGKKVGLTVSPHIDSVTERIQINLQPLDEWRFCSALEEFLQLIQGVTPQPTYFELLVAFAYWYFAKVGVDYAVIETGFGGLHDGTNVAQLADKICVITDIGLDHTKILGDTIPAIAAQKAGIIHTGNSVYVYGQTPEVDEVFRQRAQVVGAGIVSADQSDLEARYGLDGLHSLPVFQRRNWLLARWVCDAAAKKWGIPIGQEQITASLAVQVPGRMDVHPCSGKMIVMDGAHNEQKTRAFVSSFQERYPGKKVPLLLSLKQDKEYRSVLGLLRGIADTVIITSFDAMQDLPVPSMDPQTLADAAKHAGFEQVIVEPDTQKAYQKLLNMPDDMVVITGSFYLLALVRMYQRGQKVRAIAAIDDKHGLATDAGIPWDVPSDQIFVRAKTMGGVIVMGYNTYLGFAKAKPGRRNMVLVQGDEPLRAGFEPLHSAEDFFANHPDNAWLFGGASAFAQTLQFADELYITRIAGDFGCTKFMPAFESSFELVSSSPQYQENGTMYHFERWQRKH